MKQIYKLFFAFLMFGSFHSSIGAQELTLNPIGVYTAGAGDEATEILTYDESSQTIYVVNSDLNSIQRISISNPSNPTLLNTINLNNYGASANSVAVANGIVAVAIENNNSLLPGSVVLFDLDGNYLASYETGVLPDMLTFNNAGNKIIIANEGEPSDDYLSDPEGSISIINISSGATNGEVKELKLDQLGNKEEMISLGIRIYGPSASVAQDLEPEYVTVTSDDQLAFVVCQENNAVLKIDIINDTIIDILPLGYKDISQLENGIDASDENPLVDIKPWENVVGMYQPDGMASYMVNGVNYFVTANEGDARDYDGFSEESRVKDLILDSIAFPDATQLQMDDQLGRLKTTYVNGDIDNDGDHDRIYTYGGRSFSIFDENGNLVFDSGNDFVIKLQSLVGDQYAKNRSDDKGSEPESITLGFIKGQTFAFIGLERQNGFFIYNITDPTNVTYSGYGQRGGDIAPESSVFIAAAQSPNGQDLLVSANEVSGTVTVFEIIEGEFSLENSIKVFDEIVNIEDYELDTLLMPPSPLTTQVVFIGGHDIVQTTPTYGNPEGRAIAKEWNDFIGFTPDTTGSSLGWVSVNHEQIYKDDYIGDGGGMTVFRVANSQSGIEVLEQTLEDGRHGHFFNVDFVNTVGETGMNCAGISAPNGRIWTAEEWFRNNNNSIWNSSAGSSNLPLVVDDKTSGYGVRDTSHFVINTPEFPLINGDTIEKYNNFNYMVEIDPIQAKAIRKQYNWGRAGWEGGAISADGKYVYLGIDGVPAPWVRITAKTPWDFNDVLVEVYKHDNASGQRWVEITMDKENIFGGLTNAAWSAGATMFMRNEWVTIDEETGIVYWTETGRDSGSSGPGIVFPAIASSTNALIAPHHDSLAIERGFANASDPGYQDYYGRVLYYDPTTEDIGVMIEGGPYLITDPTIQEYPEKHLSNPDGLNIIKIDGKSFLMIQEDLNGSTFGRTPEGISNLLCELYLLEVDNKNATVDDLIRVTAIPKGAEITGAIQIDENTILVNSQHPNANNPFPYNHSLTLAIHGWANIDVVELTTNGKVINKILLNTTTREFHLPQLTDCAIYNDELKRINVKRNTTTISLQDLEAGTYYIITSENNAYQLIIE